MQLEIPLAGPAGEPVDLWRTLVSHGVAHLPPAEIDEDARTFRTTVALPQGRPRTVVITEAESGIAGSRFSARSCNDPMRWSRRCGES